MGGKAAGWFCVMLGVLFASVIAPLLASIRFATEEEDVVGAYLGSIVLFICAAVLLWAGAVFVQTARLGRGRIFLGAGCAIAILSLAGVMTINQGMP